jgi:hypothetical protein
MDAMIAAQMIRAILRFGMGFGIGNHKKREKQEGTIAQRMNYRIHSPPEIEYFSGNQETSVNQKEGSPVSNRLTVKSTSSAAEPKTAAKSHWLPIVQD